MAKIDKLIKYAESHLEADEQVLKSVMGAYETKILGGDSVRNGVFMATNRRLVFYAKKLTGYDMEVFPYSTISSIEMGKNLMGHYISFFASGNITSMKWINTGNVPGFVEEVKARIGKKEAPIESPDIAGQIKKLAELRGSGVLTEEEFAAKKQELLAKL